MTSAQHLLSRNREPNLLLINSALSVMNPLNEIYRGIPGSGTVGSRCIHTK